MAKRLPAKFVAANQRNALHRSIAENTVNATRFEYSRAFGPGQIVDLEESIADGVKLRDVVRSGAFEVIDSRERQKGEGQ